VVSIANMTADEQDQVEEAKKRRVSSPPAGQTTE